jgi:hypothetical protein
MWRHRPEGSYLQQHLAATQRRLPRYNATDLSMLAWSLAELKYLPSKPWLAAFLAASEQQLRASGPSAFISTARALASWQLLPDGEGPGWGRRAAPRRAALHPASVCCGPWLPAAAAAAMASPGGWAKG